MNTFVLVTSRETRPITRTPGQLGEHLYELGPVEGRKAVDAVQSGEGGERPDVGITDLTVPGDPSGEISLRIREPAGRTAGLAEVLAVSHRPLAAAAFGEPAAAAAWEVKPSRGVVSFSETTTNPDVERFGYQRAGITTVEIDSSHLVMLSHPEEVADLIRKAVAVVGEQS